MKPNDSPLLTERQVAEMLGLKNPRTLSIWRCNRRYDLPFVKVGSRIIRYRAADVEAFIKRCTVNDPSTHKT